MDDIERLLEGECLHGHKHLKDCGLCLMTRSLVLKTRQLVSQVFRGPCVIVETDESPGTETGAETPVD